MKSEYQLPLNSDQLKLEINEALVLVKTTACPFVESVASFARCHFLFTPLRANVQHFLFLYVLRSHLMYSPCGCGRLQVMVGANLAQRPRVSLPTWLCGTMEHNEYSKYLKLHET